MDVFTHQQLRFRSAGRAGLRQRLGIYFHGANGTLFADYNTLKVVPEGDKTKDLPAPARSIPPSPGHEREWLDCIKSRRQPGCNPGYHLRVHVPVMLSLLSLKLGRSIRFDPATEKIIGDPEAARLALPNYRAPWKFPSQYLTARPQRLTDQRWAFAVFGRMGGSRVPYGPRTPP